MMRAALERYRGLAVLILGACSSTTGPTVDRIVVTPVAVTLAPGATQLLSVDVLDAAGQPIAGATVTFQSGNSTIATISAAGLVTGVAPGVTTVTARSGPASATITVTVTAANPGAGSLELTPDTAFLQGTQTLQLTVAVYDTLGNPMPGAPVQYVSRDPTIVTVTTTGLVARSGSGSVDVRASSGAARDSVLVTAVIARVMLTAMPFGAAVSSAGVAYVTRALSDSVARLNLPTPTVVAGFGVGSLPSSVAFNNAGTRAYVGNQFGLSVTAINTSTNAGIGTLSLGVTPAAVAVGPGDTTLLVGTDGGQLYFVSLPALAITDSVPVPSYTNSIAIHGTTAYANTVGGTVTRIDLTTRQVTGTLSVAGVVQGLVVSQDGTELYVANETGVLQFWNIAAGTLVGSVPLSGGGGFALARNPANGLLYVSTSYYGQRVHVIDPTTRAVVRVIRTGGTPRRIGFTAAGVGIVANEDGWVDVID
jgi:YVTN family beta-propeller protein